MDQDVSESRDAPPVYLGMYGLQMIADPLSGFGKCLEIAENSVLNEFRLAKGFLAVLAIAFYAADTIEDVMNVETVVFHKGIASCNTRSRMSG